MASFGTFGHALCYTFVSPLRQWRILNTPHIPRLILCPCQNSFPLYNHCRRLGNILYTYLSPYNFHRDNLNRRNICETKKDPGVKRLHFFFSGGRGEDEVKKCLDEKEQGTLLFHDCNYL